MRLIQPRIKQRNVLVTPISPLSSSAVQSPSYQKQSNPSSGSKISPAVLIVIVILAVIFFICGILHLFVRFLVRKRSSSPDSQSSRYPEMSGSESFQRQLQQLFNLHDSGLDQAFIDALPVFLYKDIKGLKEPFDCAVCLCEFSEHDKLRLLPLCSHAFHVDCIDTWLLSNSTCPLCRGTLFVPGFSIENPVFDFDDSRIDEDGFSGSIRIGVSCGQKPADHGEVASEKRMFPVRLGKFRSTNVEGINDTNEMGEPSNSNLDARRCYSMGSFQYVVGNSELQVAFCPNSRGRPVKGRIGFISLVNLQLSKNHKVYISPSVLPNSNSSSNPENIINVNQIELGLIQIDDHIVKHEETSEIDVFHKSEEENENSEYINKSINCLSYTIGAYFLAVHVLCSLLISLYIESVPSAKQVLENKGIKISTFSVFTAVSSFSNCGFIPTKENMMVFKKNTGLLLILIPQCLVGNTLYPTCLLLVIFVLKTCTKRPEFGYILSHHNKLGYNHLMSKKKCCYLAATVFGFILIQFVIFVSMEWNNSGIMEGLNSYEKIVASLFQVTNTRHTGESVFDLSAISPAVLVVFVTMMYFSPYTSFFPVTDGTEKSCSDVNDDKITCTRRRKTFVEYLLLSVPTYLIIFIILICISERKNLKEDPLNFNVLNIIIEVISAYGNVGFSMGYSCERQIKADEQCKDTYSGFAGRWSDTGKWILVIVMLFGRLKYFHKGGAKAWKLF